MESKEKALRNRSLLLEVASYINKIESGRTLVLEKKISDPSYLIFSKDSRNYIRDIIGPPGYGGKIIVGESTLIEILLESQKEGYEFCCFI